MRLIATLALTLVALATATPGCTPAATADTPSTDGMTAPSPSPDLACPPRACVAMPDEDCGACMRHIGECCYGDTQLGVGAVSVHYLVEGCQKNPGCAACCDECAALSCNELRARGNCPYTP